MISINLKPTHQAVKAYYEELKTLENLDFYSEGAVSPAFAALLRHCARQGRLTLVEQYSLKKNGRILRVDGALLDQSDAVPYDPPSRLFPPKTANLRQNTLVSPPLFLCKIAAGGACFQA